MKKGSICKRILAAVLTIAIAAGGGGVFVMRTAKEAWAAGQTIKKDGDVDHFARFLSIADVTFDFSGSSWQREVGGKFNVDGNSIYLNQAMGVVSEYTPTADDKIKFTYPGGAVMSDGVTRKDVTIEYKITKIHVAGNNPSSGNVTGFPVVHSGEAHHMRSSVYKGSTTEQWATALEGTITISIGGGKLFVLPAQGFNQNKKSSWGKSAFLYMSQNLTTYENFLKEKAIIPQTAASTICVPEGSEETESVTTSSTETTIKGERTDGANNASYLSGFAIDGKASGISLQYGVVGGINETGTQSNDEFLRLGELTHTIWSSTTPGGNIQTTRGTDLEAANEDHDLNDGTEKLDPGYYSVPNYKAVTYTMDSAPGYRIRKLYVDGSEATPAGMEKLDGAVNRYWYTFEADATNHEIFVEWEPIPADVDVTKVWDDSGETDARPSELTVKLSPEGYLPAQKITNTKTGNEQSVTGWGHNNAWTGADGTAVVKEPTTMGWRSYSGSDAPFTTIFYDTGDKTWYNYTINNRMTKNGYPTGYTKGAAVTQKVDFLPRYSGSAEVEYSVTEDPNPPADYKADTSVNKVNTGRDKDVDKTAEYDVTITNTYVAPAPPVIEEEEIELSRKITYQYIDKNGKMAQETKVQKVRLKRTREQGQDFWEPWVAEGSFPAVTSPTEKEDPVRLTNWVPDRNAPALSKEDIEKAANAKIPTDRNIDGLTDAELAALLSEISDSFTQAIFYHPPSLKPEPASPQKGEVKAANTGDETNQGLPAAVLAFSLTGAVMMVYTLRKRRQAK